MLIVCGVFVALFPDPAQFSTVCSMKKWERVSSALQAREHWAGPGNEARVFLVMSVLPHVRNYPDLPYHLERCIE